VLLCIRAERLSINEMTVWRDAAEALEAVRELCHPCGRLCESSHLVVYSEDDRLRVVSESPPRLSLDEELQLLYPRLLGDGVEHWPEPEMWNPRLEKPLVAPALRDPIERGHAVALQRLLARL
jgi:hypothetical protein